MAFVTHSRHLVTTLAKVDPLTGDESEQITLSGFSDSPTAINPPDIDLLTSSSRALDGSLRGFYRKKNGGPFTFEFLSTSRAVSWFSKRAEEIENGETFTIKGDVLNTQTKETGAMRGGLLNTYRPFPQFGGEGLSVMPYEIEFESVRGDYSVFRPVDDE